ncbi:MAG: calcium-binding protein, partial [Caulobacteraceae bacterium]|nr:calcium-binding protein [Caulobacter sp.]
MPLDPLTIVFALVAIVVAWKLKSVLGERTGTERQPPRDLFQKPQAGDPKQQGQRPPGGFGDRNVIRLPGVGAAPAALPDPDRWRDVAPAGSPVAAGLDAIAAADPTFSAAPFL